MTESEFSALKRKAKSCDKDMSPKISHKYLDDMKLPEKYFDDSETPKRQRSDYARFIENLNLKNKMIMEKVKAQIKFEKERKKNTKSNHNGYPDWQKLINSKLFNSPKI